MHVKYPHALEKCRFTHATLCDFYLDLKKKIKMWHAFKGAWSRILFTGDVKVKLKGVTKAKTGFRPGA